MYLNELQALAHEQSVNKGFWATYDMIPLHLSDKSKGLQEELRVAILSQKLALVSSESTEALEDLRAGKPYEGEDALHIAEDGKPEGFASELADIVIRVLDLAEGVGIHLEQVIDLKLRYNNESRGKLHGKAF